VRLQTHRGVDGFPILVDAGSQRLSPIGGKTSLHQEFDPSTVFDPEFVLNGVPQSLASFAQLPRRCNRGERRWLDDRQR